MDCGIRSTPGLSYTTLAATLLAERVGMALNHRFVVRPLGGKPLATRLPRAFAITSLKVFMEGAPEKSNACTDEDDFPPKGRTTNDETSPPRARERSKASPQAAAFIPSKLIAPHPSAALSTLTGPASCANVSRAPARLTLSSLYSYAPGAAQS